MDLIVDFDSLNVLDCVVMRHWDTKMQHIE